MPYDPGISYRGDQYTFQGIAGLGQSLGAGIDEFKKKREKTEKELAFADSVMDHARQTGRITGEEFNKYIQQGAGKKHSMALGTIANIADDFARQKFQAERDDAAAARAQALAIAGMQEGGALSRAQMQMGQANLHYLGNLAEGKARANEALGMHEESLAAQAARQKEELAAHERMANLPYLPENQFKPSVVQAPIEGGGGATVPMGMTSRGQAQFLPGAGGKTLTPSQQMNDLDSRVFKSSGGHIADWSTAVNVNVDKDGYINGEIPNADKAKRSEKIRMSKTAYDNYVKEFRELEGGGAGTTATGPTATAQFQQDRQEAAKWIQDNPGADPRQIANIKRQYGL